MNISTSWTFSTLRNEIRNLWAYLNLFELYTFKCIAQINLSFISAESEFIILISKVCYYLNVEHLNEYFFKVASGSIT